MRRFSKGDRVRFKLRDEELDEEVEYVGEVRKLGETTYLVTTEQDMKVNPARVHMMKEEELSLA